MSSEVLRHVKNIGQAGGIFFFVALFALLCTRLACIGHTSSILNVTITDNDTNGQNDKERRNTVDKKETCQFFNVSLSVSATLQLCHQLENEYPVLKLLIQHSPILELLPKESLEFVKWLDNCFLANSAICLRSRSSHQRAKSQNYSSCSSYSSFELDNSVHLCLDSKTGFSFLTFNGYPFSSEETLLIYSLIRAFTR